MAHGMRVLDINQLHHPSGCLLGNLRSNLHGCSLRSALHPALGQLGGDSKVDLLHRRLLNRGATNHQEVQEDQYYPKRITRSRVKLSLPRTRGLELEDETD